MQRLLGFEPHSFQSKDFMLHCSEVDDHGSRLTCRRYVQVFLPPPKPRVAVTVDMNEDRVPFKEPKQ